MEPHAHRNTTVLHWREQQVAAQLHQRFTFLHSWTVVDRALEDRRNNAEKKKKRTEKVWRQGERKQEKNQKNQTIKSYYHLLITKASVHFFFVYRHLVSYRVQAVQAGKGISCSSLSGMYCCQTLKSTKSHSGSTSGFKWISFSRSSCALWRLLIRPHPGATVLAEGPATCVTVLYSDPTKASS